MASRPVIASARALPGSGARHPCSTKISSSIGQGLGPNKKRATVLSTVALPTLASQASDFAKATSDRLAGSSPRCQLAPARIATMSTIRFKSSIWDLVPSLTGAWMHLGSATRFAAARFSRSSVQTPKSPRPSGPVAVLSQLSSGQVAERSARHRVWRDGISRVCLRK